MIRFLCLLVLAGFGSVVSAGEITGRAEVRGGKLVICVVVNQWGDTQDVRLHFATRNEEAAAVSQIRSKVSTRTCEATAKGERFTDENSRHAMRVESYKLLD